MQLSKQGRSCNALVFYFACQAYLDGQNLGGRRLRHRCLSNGTVGGTSQDRGGSQISEWTFDHGRTFLKRVDVRFESKADSCIAVQ